MSAVENDRFSRLFWSSASVENHPLPLTRKDPMPSPVFLLSHRKVEENVAIGNDSASKTITLTFSSILPNRYDTQHRPIRTPEGSFDIVFIDKVISDLTAEEQARGFEKGKLYRLVPIDPIDPVEPEAG